MSVVIVSRRQQTPRDTTSPEVPLIDMGELPDGRVRQEPVTYHGLEGGLFDGGSNTPPAAHVTAGLASAALVEPLDTSGNPSPTGKIVVSSIGMSNMQGEMCITTASNITDPGSCTVGSLMQRCAADATINPVVEVVLGAQTNQTIPEWNDASDANWNRVRDDILAPQGLSQAQVQVLLLKNVIANPTVPLPSEDADVYAVYEGLKDIITLAKARYPNLRQVFMTSRVYAGWNASDPGNARHPEPFAYESGFAVKWLISDYIAGTFAPGPFITWGPYAWCNGDTPRSDGLTWPQSYLTGDGIHPSTGGGVPAWGGLWHDFLKTSPYTEPWFVA